MGGARQAEKEDRSTKESKMIAERNEFQTFNSEQSQTQSACQLREPMPSRLNLKMCNRKE
eukprot:1145631-Pelagomonas_calceolata.AAC.11